MSTLIARAESIATCTRHLRDLAKELPDDEALAAALRQCARERRGGAFQRLVLAAPQAEREIPADVLVEGASLLPDMRALATAAVRCSGNVAEALIGAVRDGRLGEWDAYAVYIAAWWARQQAPPDDLPAVLQEARAVGRRRLGEEAQVVLSALAALTEDKALRTVLRNEGQLVPDKEAAATARDLETWFTAPPLLDLPAKPPPRPTVTTKPRVKVGRNEACPCGSGVKYKKCCWGKDAPGAPPTPTVDADRLAALTGWELCRLEPPEVPEELRTEWVNQLLMAAEYERVAAVLVAIGTEGRDAQLADALRWATATGRSAAVQALLALAGPDAIGGGARMFALREDRAAQLTQAEERALELADDRHGELAFDLLDGGLPGLALHVARGALAVAEDNDLSLLFQSLLQVRDRAGLGPVDLVEERLLPWLQGGRLVEDSGLKQALEDKTLEAERLRQELTRVRADHKARLAALEAERASEPVPEEAPETEDVDPEVVRELRRRIAALKQDLKVRHQERNTLRGEVEELQEALHEAQLAGAPEVAAEPVVDDEAVEESPGGPHPVRLPVVPEGIRDTLASLPEPVQRQAIELLGRLAAGRPDAFRGARPLRGRSWLWRQKVGRSYRMFFTLEPHVLEVVDVIHRQDLEKRIRELS